MPTDVTIALLSGLNNIRAVRVSDGTDTAAVLKIVDNTGFATDTVTVGGVFAAGVALSVTLTPATGSPITVNYTTQTSDTNVNGVAASLANAINASSAVIGPNQFIQPASAAAAVISLKALASGVGGNSIALATSGSGVTLTAGGANFTSGAAAGVIATLTGKFTGSLANGATARIDAGSNSTTTSPSYRLSLAFSGNSVPEVFDNIVAYSAPGGSYSASSFEANLVNAVNGTPALSALRPASAYFTAVAGASTQSPLTATLMPVLTNGTDGSAFASGATFAQLGSDTAQPKTGMYALSGQIGGGKFCLSGNTDIANASAAQIAFANRENAIAYLALPQGTSSVAAITAKVNAGVQSYSAVVLNNFCEFTDTTNNVNNRRVSPCAFAIARTCLTSPETSPANQRIAIVTGTERYSGAPGAQQQPYSPNELAQLEQNGINAIVLGAPGGQYFAIRHNKNSFSNSPPQNNIAYSTMTQFLSQSINSTLLGQFVGMAQSRQPQDPVRSKARSLLNDFLQRLADASMIDSFLVQCDLRNNPVSAIAAGLMRADVTVVYMGIVDRLVISVTGGQTVRIVSNPNAVTANS